MCALKVVLGGSKCSHVSSRCFSFTPDMEWVSQVRVNTQAVLRRAQHFQALKVPKERWQVQTAFVAREPNPCRNTAFTLIFSLDFYLPSLPNHICKCVCVGGRALTKSSP